MKVSKILWITLLAAFGCMFLGCAARLRDSEYEPSVITVGIVRAEHNPANLWSFKLHIGSSDPAACEFLTISTNGQQQRIRVETCEEYTNAIAHGAYAFTTADMALDAWFRRAVATLTFLESAQSPATSVPFDYLQALPVSVLGWNDSDQEAQLAGDAGKGMTIMDYSVSGRLKNFKVKGNTITFNDDVRHYTVEELARGDYDGDGVEDALMSVSWQYSEGSGRGNEYHVWSKAKLLPCFESR